MKHGASKTHLEEKAVFGILLLTMAKKMKDNEL
jgi:hypothetical protein